MELRSQTKNRKKQSKEDSEDSDTRPPSRSSSQDTNCPICLEPLANKSFTDGCFHTFCFTCLLEWSKVKPECPLCKQQFKCIVHNVQSNYSYDEYHINEGQRFRYPTTLTTRFEQRNIESYQDTYNEQIESHRMRYAPHAARLLSSSQNMSQTPDNFRMRVYTEGMWVLPGNRIRTVSPEFYRHNTACAHRLLPWLNRELVALLGNNETQVTFVIELIMALIVRYEINSQEFFVHVEPYFGVETRHFIHELYNFAISPHDLETYDRDARYLHDQHFDLDNEVQIVKETNLGPSTSATTIRYRDISGELSRPSSPPATSSATVDSDVEHLETLINISSSDSSEKSKDSSHRSSQNKQKDKKKKKKHVKRKHCENSDTDSS